MTESSIRNLHRGNQSWLFKSKRYAQGCKCVHRKAARDSDFKVVPSKDMMWLSELKELYEPYEIA